MFMLYENLIFYALFTNDNCGEGRNFEVICEKFAILRVCRVMEASTVGMMYKVVQI